MPHDYVWEVCLCLINGFRNKFEICLLFIFQHAVKHVKDFHWQKGVIAYAIVLSNVSTTKRFKPNELPNDLKLRKVLGKTQECLKTP